LENQFSQAKLAADYPWIPSEEPLFGVKGGDYDWNARSAEAAVAELKELADAHDKQSKKVNKKVLAMFDKAEGEYQELVAKRAIVEKDKEKIQQVRLMLFFLSRYHRAGKGWDEKSAHLERWCR